MTFAVVTGLPRSGTSMVMRMLDQGGLPSFHNTTAKNRSNPHGYYEYVHDTDDLSHFAKIDGRCIKILTITTIPLGSDCRVICMTRDPEAQVESWLEHGYQRAVVRRPRERSTPELVEGGRAAVEELVQSCSFPLIRVRYEDVLRDPRGESARIATFLGRALDLDKMAAVVDPSLCHWGKP